MKGASTHGYSVIIIHALLCSPFKCLDTVGPYIVQLRLDVNACQTQKSPKRLEGTVGCLVSFIGKRTTDWSNLA